MEKAKCPECEGQIAKQAEVSPPRYICLACGKTYTVSLGTLYAIL